MAKITKPLDLVGKEVQLTLLDRNETECSGVVISIDPSAVLLEYDDHGRTFTDLYPLRSVAFISCKTSANTNKK